MPPGRSVDIDTAADMAKAERLLAGWGGTLPEPGQDTLEPETDR